MAQILVTDDDEPIRETLRFLLEDAGYDVVEAPDGAAALQTLRASAAPMVVLLDVMMPRMNGYQVLSDAANGDPLLAHHAFIMLTASPQARTAALGQLRRQLAVPCLEKPFDIEELLDLVAQVAHRLDEVNGADGRMSSGDDTRAMAATMGETGNGQAAAV
jgi:CheY-like chemotaxis protein